MEPPILLEESPKRIKKFVIQVDFWYLFSFIFIIHQMKNKILGIFAGVYIQTRTKFPFHDLQQVRKRQRGGNKSRRKKGV